MSYANFMNIDTTKMEIANKKFRLTEYTEPGRTVKLFMIWYASEFKKYDQKNIFSGGFTVRKMKFSIRNFFSKCDQIRRKLRIWSHLLEKSLMENLNFCAVF